MGVKSLIARLQSWAADTPDTLEKITGYHRKAPIHAGCTPDTSDTSCSSDTRSLLQNGPLPVALAANDSKPPPKPLPKTPPEPNAWRELARAYHAHHFNCQTCIAAGRSAVHGLRCSTGVALWNNYQNT